MDPRAKSANALWNISETSIFFYVAENTLTVPEKLLWIHLYFLGSPASARMPLKQIDQRCSQNCKYKINMSAYSAKNGILTQTRMHCKGNWILGYNKGIAQCQKASRRRGKNQWIWDDLVCFHCRLSIGYQKDLQSALAMLWEAFVDVVKLTLTRRG